MTQAVAWIKSREGRQLDGRIRMQTERDFLKQLELALQYGFPFLVANLDEWLDPILDPLLEKAVTLQARCMLSIIVMLQPPVNTCMCDAPRRRRLCHRRQGFLVDGQVLAL